jgi:hypothetical protein
VKGFEWWVQGHTFRTDAKIIDTGAYDLVLGTDWLEQFSPMTCDWLAKWIEFKYHQIAGYAVFPANTTVVGSI